MKYNIVPSKRFLKRAKKYRESGKTHVLLKAEEAIHLLSVHDANSLFLLSTRWRDHELKGDKVGIRELHLGFDELLLYRMDHEAFAIELLDMINHEDLKKM